MNIFLQPLFLKGVGQPLWHRGNLNISKPYAGVKSFLRENDLLTLKKIFVLSDKWDKIIASF